jgi:hypothetical protein
VITEKGAFGENDQVTFSLLSLIDKLNYFFFVGFEVGQRGIDLG